MVSQKTYKGIIRENVERAARLYRTNTEASLALGVSSSYFRDLCRKYNIESPADRTRRCKV